MKHTLVIAACVLVSSGCNSTGNDPGPGGVTKAEAEALDAAAEKLETQAQIPENTAAKAATAPK